MVFGIDLTLTLLQKELKLTQKFRTLTIKFFVEIKFICYLKKTLWNPPNLIVKYYYIISLFFF